MKSLSAHPEEALEWQKFQERMAWNGIGQKLEVVNTKEPENFISREGRTRNGAFVAATIGVTIVPFHFPFYNPVIFSQDLCFAEKAQNLLPALPSPPTPTGDNQLEVLQS